MRKRAGTSRISLAIFVLTALLGVVCAGAQVGLPPASPGATAAAWDSIVQARFHRVRPGHFGEHALFGLLGEAPAAGAVNPLDSQSPQESAQLAPAIRSGRIVLVGILHCRFKPSRDVSLDKSTKPDAFQPSAEAVECIAPSQAAAANRLAWARKRFGSAALPAFPMAMRNEPYNSHYAGYLVAVRPVTAHAPICLTCHHGAKVGDTLGAVIYLVSEQHQAKPSRFVQRDLAR